MERGTAAPPHFSSHFALARSPISAAAELFVALDIVSRAAVVLLWKVLYLDVGRLRQVRGLGRHVARHIGRACAVSTARLIVR